MVISKDASRACERLGVSPNSGLVSSITCIITQLEQEHGMLVAHQLQVVDFARAYNPSAVVSRRIIRILACASAITFWRALAARTIERHAAVERPHDRVAGKHDLGARAARSARRSDRSPTRCPTCRRRFRAWRSRWRVDRLRMHVAVADRRERFDAEEKRAAEAAAETDWRSARCRACRARRTWY